MTQPVAIPFTLTRHPPPDTCIKVVTVTFSIYSCSRNKRKRIKRSRRNPGAEIISPPFFYKRKKQKFSNNCFPIEIDVSPYSRESVAEFFISSLLFSRFSLKNIKGQEIEQFSHFVYL